MADEELQKHNAYSEKHKKLDAQEVRKEIKRRREELQKRTVRWRNRWLTQEEEGDVVKGVATRGLLPARLITRAEDFGHLQPRDILVAAYTNPTWIPLFTVAAGVVGDTGGAASHAAIVAREYGIPAVMGTGRATSCVTAGEIITVDGYAGVVRRGKRARGIAPLQKSSEDLVENAGGSCLLME
ncbi:MAG: rifampicin phosphotransferase [Eubacteriales bacterium]|nr:rifampicin phosphotransferase [Eubacteriales bacterium]